MRGKSTTVDVVVVVGMRESSGGGWVRSDWWWGKGEHEHVLHTVTLTAAQHTLEQTRNHLRSLPAPRG